MSIDLQGLSAKQLETLITQAKKRQTALSKRNPAKTVRARINAFLKTEGYTIAELYGTGAAAKSASTGEGKAAAKKAPRKGRKLGKVAPKYRNPAKPAETWTGRGKHPRWMAELLKKGKKVEDFLIKK